MLSSTFELENIYNLFGFEPLFDAKLGKLKLPKECAVNFYGSGGVMENPDKVVERIKPLSGMGVSILHGVASLLAVIDLFAGVSQLQVKFSIKVSFM